MISSVQGTDVSVSLTPKMKQAGLDASPQLSNFEKLFSGITFPAEEKDAAPAEPVFSPKYKSAKGFDGSTGAVYQMNETCYADQDTAQWVANKYGTGEIRESDVLGQGPFSVDTKMFEIKLENGNWVNAGMLAAYYDRNPERLFPGLADKLVRNLLESA